MTTPDGWRTPEPATAYPPDVKLSLLLRDTGSEALSVELWLRHDTSAVALAQTLREIADAFETGRAQRIE